MKKIIAGLLAIATLFLTSCGGVSQAEYDKVVAERDALQALIDTQEALFATENKDNDIDSSVELDDIPISDMSSAISIEQKHIGINEVATSDKFNITFLDCITTQRVDESRYFYYSASEGMVYAILAFRIENISTNNENIWPHSDFEYYADNVLYDSVGFGYTPPRIQGYAAIDSDNILAPGRVMEGYVACEIPIETKRLEVEYEGFIFDYDFV